MIQFLIDVFEWPRRMKRNRLRKRRFSATQLGVLEETVPGFSNWPENKRTRLVDAVKILNGEKHWEGCDDMVIDEMVKTTISGQAARMLMGVDNYFFDALHTILVFPETYEREMADGLLVSEQSLAGQAWGDGRIALAWSDIVHGIEFPHDGHNVVIHEFAHHIDAITGYFDGQPKMPGVRNQRLWRQVSEREYRQLVEEVSAMKPTVLDPYGATNPAEFFAVASETFFERPDLLAEEHSQLYQLLKQLYQLDPLSDHA